jgi:hypothetical protein
MSIMFFECSNHQRTAHQPPMNRLDASHCSKPVTLVFLICLQENLLDEVDHICAWLMTNRTMV